MPRNVENIAEIDRTIGRLIKELRRIKNMSREELAKLIGVTHQQLQKYEKGTNRITAGRLFAIANALGKPLHFFYQEVSAEVGKPVLEDPVNYRKSMEVMRNFMKIRNVEHQNAINVLIRKLANAQSTEETEISTNS